MLFIYNFDGTIYETTEAFDDTYRELKKSCIGTPTRQVVKPDGKIICQVLKGGCIWLEED